MTEHKPEFIDESSAPEGGVIYPAELHIEVPVNASHETKMKANAYNVATEFALGAEAGFVPMREGDTQNKE